MSETPQERAANLCPLCRDNVPRAGDTHHKEPGLDLDVDDLRCTAYRFVWARIEEEGRAALAAATPSATKGGPPAGTTLADPEVAPPNGSAPERRTSYCPRCGGVFGLSELLPRQGGGFGHLVQANVKGGQAAGTLCGPVITHWTYLVHYVHPYTGHTRVPMRLQFEVSCVEEVLAVEKRIRTELEKSTPAEVRAAHVGAPFPEVRALHLSLLRRESGEAWLR